MSTRERQTPEHPLQQPRFGEEPQPAESQAREQGDAFLVAADSAITRALSGNAQAFLRQNRQLGGQ